MREFGLLICILQVTLCLNDIFCSLYVELSTRRASHSYPQLLQSATQQCKCAVFAISLIGLFIL